MNDLTKEVKWNARTNGEHQFTQRQMERFAYRAIARFIVRIESMQQGTPEEKRAYENAENGLATLFGDAPAKPSIALPEGLAIINQIKTDIARVRLAHEAETRRKIQPTDPLAVAAAKTQTADLPNFAFVMMRQTKPNRLPHRSSS